MPVGALLGFAYGAACVALLATRFHHDVMRIFEARDRLHHRGSVLLDVDCRGDFVQRHPRLAVNIPLALGLGPALAMARSSLAIRR